MLSSLLFIGLLLYFDDLFIRRHYRAYWRAEIMRFFQTAPVSLATVADELERLKGEKVYEKKIEKTDDIARLLRNDAAMIFYVTAHSLLP